ncbi:tRNA 2'-phosphotransferase isoform X2 [Lycorma delicatula]|uniref:tRNA 2'-phosphotransferase isoform X2 n=1 Tax=Lycorma delicatula TaxID=130591 RepID=UPI003F518FBC
MEGRSHSSHHFNNDITISKCLSRLLRHSAKEEGLNITHDGYVPVSEIIKHRSLARLGCKVDDICRIVETNDKKRFTLRNTTELEICANQGHTLLHCMKTYF